MQHYDDKLLLDAQLCFPLYAAARKVVNLYGPIFRPLGITYTQYIVFLVLWETDGIPVGELCRRLYLDNGTLTPMLKKMEKAGWLTRSRSREDERVVIIHLTEAGRALHEQAKAIPDKIGSCINLPPEKFAQLYDLLYELLGNMQPSEAVH